MQTPNEIIGPLQAKVMDLLWEDQRNGGKGMLVASVLKQIKDRKYTTLLTVLRNLAKRGIVSQTPVEGARKPHVFAPKLTREAYLDAVFQLVADRFFGGDRHAAAARMAAGAP